MKKMKKNCLQAGQPRGYFELPSYKAASLLRAPTYASGFGSGYVVINNDYVGPKSPFLKILINKKVTKEIQNLNFMAAIFDFSTLNQKTLLII